MQARIRGKSWGNFNDFPHYQTAGQNAGVLKDIDYTPQQVTLLAQEMAFQVLQFDYHTGIISKWFGGDYYQAKGEYGSYGFDDYGAYSADYTPPAIKAGPYVAPAYHAAAVATYAADGSLSGPSASASDSVKSVSAGAGAEQNEATHHAVFVIASIGRSTQEFVCTFAC